MKSATSWALNRQVDVSDLSKPIDEDNLKVRFPLDGQGLFGVAPSILCGASHSPPTCSRHQMQSCQKASWLYTCGLPVAPAAKHRRLRRVTAPYAVGNAEMPFPELGALLGIVTATSTPALTGLRSSGRHCLRSQPVWLRASRR